MSELIKAIISVKGPFSLMAFVSVVLLLAFRTKAIPGLVFSGSLDGHLRAYSAADGTVIWDVDTARDYTTVNGAKGRGGSLDGPGAVVVGGMLFVNSGYSRFDGMPGNVLLAFAPKP